MNRLLDHLTAPAGRSARLTHVEHSDPRPAVYVEWPGWVPASVIDLYDAAGVKRPWAHQVRAANLLHDSVHTVIATPTGSGKSLAFWLPALSDYAGASAPSGRISATLSRPTALYVAPTKALAADQIHALHTLTHGSDVPLPAATCDGDTPWEHRSWIQQNTVVVATNPDFLHFSLMPQHQRWARFLRGLRYVIVDEAHAYRGVFGSHVALVLRRLRRIVAHYGAEPTFALASATTSEPSSSAARLLGIAQERIAVVEHSDAPQGRRTVALWKPAELLSVLPLPDSSEGSTVDPWLLDLPEGAAPAENDVEELPATGGVRRSASAEATDLLTELIDAHARTLTFVRSRFSAEQVADSVRRRLADRDSGLVATYRGGYLPEERRALERALRKGMIKGLVTTNALELGIDISGLDAVLIVGWPGTRVSLWQQAGRAGRGGKDGLAIWIAGNNPLESYVADHPETVFGAPLEQTMFDPANPYVMAPHLAAAAAEVPLTERDEDLFGPTMETILAQLTDQGLLRHRPTGWYWVLPEPATSLCDLRGSGGAPVQIVESETGTVLGTVDSARADSTVHPGAMYAHQGRSYLVDELDLTDGVALVRPQAPRFTTMANSITNVSIREPRLVGDEGRWHFGMITVSSQVTSYTRMRVPGLEKMDTRSLDLPERELYTAGCWWTVAKDEFEQAGIAPADIPGALHAAEHASIGLLPLLATCDRWDLGGLSTAWHPDTDRATVFVYDALPGGSGFAERGFTLASQWLLATRDLISRCPCADGCPACIQSPKCGNGNHPLNKAAALSLLRLITR